MSTTADGVKNQEDLVDAFRQFDWYTFNFVELVRECQRLGPQLTDQQLRYVQSRVHKDRFGKDR